MRVSLNIRASATLSSRKWRPKRPPSKLQDNFIQNLKCLKINFFLTNINYKNNKTSNFLHSNWLAVSNFYWCRVMSITFQLFLTACGKRIFFSCYYDYKWLETKKFFGHKKKFFWSIQCFFSIYTYIKFLKLLQKKITKIQKNNKSNMHFFKHIIENKSKNPTKEAD